MSEDTPIRGPVITTWALALAAVCLRYCARKVSKAGFWFDDWLIITATVSIPGTIKRGKYLGGPGAQSKLMFPPAPCHCNVRCLGLLE